MGSGRTLSDEQAGHIQHQIDNQSPEGLGIPSPLWSRRAVRDLIRKELGISMPVRTVGEDLERWGYTAKRPRRHNRKQDPEEVQRWLEETYPAIAKRAEEEGAEIHWCDETGVAADEHPRYGYAPPGTPGDHGSAGQAHPRGPGVGELLDSVPLLERQARARANACAPAHAVAAEVAWERVRGAFEFFTPEGRLNARCHAEAVVAEAIPSLSGPAWAKTRRLLQRPESFTFLDQVQQRMARLGLEPEVLSAALDLEGERDKSGWGSLFVHRFPRIRVS